MRDPLTQALIRLCETRGRRAVAQAIGANEQTLYQIIAGVPLPSGAPRGVGRNLRQRLDSAFPGWATSTPSGAPTVGEGVAQYLSHPARRVTPIAVPWERLVSQHLEQEFQTEMPDASMEPEIRKGATIIFVTGVDPVPGDFVLVADGQGHAYLREYRATRPGQWQAHAYNTAFLPLDSERDQLRVLAVFDGVRGRRGKA